MNKLKKPLVSVVMPVYNAGEFIVESIESILNQTYGNFEFIIVDDASTDNSYEIAKHYADRDPRITLLRNRTNQGVSITVKRAIRKAKGTYLARMDADDISHPTRLEKQVKYLMFHLQTVAVGAQCQIINEYGEVTGKKTFPLEFEKIYRYIFTFVPLQQPSLMIARTRLPKNFEFYHDGMNTAEEIELIFKLFTYGRVENMPEYLLQYRIHSHNTSFKNLRQTFYLTLISRIKSVSNYGYKPHFMDILINIMQLTVISILPQRTSLWLYRQIRNIASKKRSIPFFGKRSLTITKLSI